MSNQTTIQELGMSNKIHLCDSCTNKFPTCKNDNVIFGDGKGNDNVCCCSGFTPVVIEKLEIYGSFTTEDEHRTIGHCVSWSADRETAAESAKSIGWWCADGIVLRKNAIKVNGVYYAFDHEVKESDLKDRIQEFSI